MHVNRVGLSRGTSSFAAPMGHGSRTCARKTTVLTFGAKISSGTCRSPALRLRYMFIRHGHCSAKLTNDDRSSMVGCHLRSRAFPSTNSGESMPDKHIYFLREVRQLWFLVSIGVKVVPGRHGRRGPEVFGHADTTFNATQTDTNIT